MKIRRLEGYVSPPNLLLSCTSEDDPPAARPVSLGNATVTSPKKEPMSVVKVKLEDCHEMLGPDGVYNIPTEDGNHDADGSCGYNQHDDDVDDCDDDDGYDGGGDGDNGDYDPTTVNSEKTPRRRQYKSTGQRPKKTHECSECGNVFLFRSWLLLHKKTHSTDKTKVKSHKCSECGKSFTSQSRLSVHQKVHDKTKPLTNTHVETQTTVEDGVYKVPTEDGNQDGDGRSGYNQWDDDVDDSDDDGCDGGGDNDKDDGDYDPTSILATNSKTPWRRQYKSKGQRQRKTHECSECGKVFPFPSLLLRHQKTHSTDKTRERQTVSESQQENHDGIPKEHCKESLKKDRKMYQCDVCGKILSSSSNLSTHKRVHSDLRQYVCAQCGKGFIQRCNLQDHMRTHTQERPFLCSWCPKKFIRSDALKLHERRKHTGERPYSCNLCNKSFTDTFALSSHQRSHSDERPFLCLQCGFRCKHKLSLKKHEAIHAGERSSCEFCDKTFSVFYHLKRHLRTHTGEKPFKCSECDKTFASKTTLDNHALIHTGEKAHLCSVCGKAFARPDALKTHQRVHTGEKPFQCSVCEEKFSYIQTLQSHQKREHGVGPSHKCSQCGDGFKTAKELESHECVQGGKEKNLEEQADEAVNSLL